MPSPFFPTLVELSGHGPFEMPETVGCLGIGSISELRPIPRIHLCLVDGKELQLPMQRPTLEQVYLKLKAHFDPDEN